MFMKYKQPKKGERSSVALGKAECTVDCSAKEALAWWFDYCSRERQRSSDEDGNHGESVREKKMGRGRQAQATTYHLSLF